MSIESQPLRLLPYRRRLLQDGGSIIEIQDARTSRDSVLLPVKFKVYLDAVEKGFSLAQMAELAPIGGTAARFERLKEFLLLLSDNDLLADRAYQSLAESLAPEFKWPQAPISTEIASFKLVSGRGQIASPSLPFMIVSFSLAAGLFAWCLTILSNLVSHGSLQLETSGLRLLAFACLIPWLGKSVQAFLWWMTARSAGCRAQLKFVIEPFSIRLATELGGAKFSNLSLATFFLSIFSIGIAAKLLSLTDSTGAISWLALFFYVGLLGELSPFSKSSLTDLFRSSFAVSKNSSERLSKNVHVAASLFWTALVGISAVVVLFPALKALLTLLGSAGGTSKTGFLIVFFILPANLISWIVEIFSSFSYDSQTAGAARRLWSWKSSPVLDAAQLTSPSAEDLERLPFLRQIEPHLREKLLAGARVQAVERGTAVCKQGDIERALFVVLGGRFAVAKSVSFGSGRVSRRKVVAFLEPGAVFGEAAFFFGQPRTADIVSLEAGRVLKIPHTDSMKTLDSDEANQKWHETSKSTELQTRIWFLQALMRSDLFKTLPSESLDSILVAGQRRVFAAGQRIIQEGEIADDCYFIVQGQASVTQNTKLLRRLQTGDAFGEIAILNPGTLRTASVTADSELIAISIGGAQLWVLLKNHLSLALEIERLSRARLAR